MLSAEARQRLRQLEFISRRKVEDILQGRYASLFKGQGLEFSEVREYVPGDDVRYLDWNVSARVGRPFVKMNVEERELTLVFLLDGSPSMGLGGGIGTKADLAAQAIAMLSFAALRFGHRVGMLCFSDRVEYYLEPQRGHHHVLRLLGKVLEPRVGGEGTDIEGALHYFNRIYPRKAVLFLLSDLLEPRLGMPTLRDLVKDDCSLNIPETLERSVNLSCHRHDLSVLRLLSPLERELPEVGWVRWRDSENGERLAINTSNRAMRERYAAILEKYSTSWRSLLERSGGSYGEFSCAEELLPHLLAFMAQKKRRRRI